MKTRTLLTAGYADLAIQLQEAAGDLSASDTVSRLREAVRAAHADTMSYGYYLDHFGDDESGDCVYCSGGDTFIAPYTIQSGDGTAAKATIDTDAQQKVSPRTIYEPDADEADHYAAMEESYKRDKLYTGLPLYERFIAKSERDAANSGDFAGKGKSFPILKSGDVMAAVRSMGRAGASNHGAATLKANIIRIAKKKGFAKSLPKSWQGGDAENKEGAAKPSGSLALVESAAAMVEVIRVSESAAVKTVPIKLIAPGKGSTAFYTAEALKTSGPKVFAVNTHVYANHATAAEEAARPEGDVTQLAGVLATPARWEESFKHPRTGEEMGPGLYADVKPFSDHAELFTEKGEYLGMSIRANGSALTESGGKPVMREGVPVLKEFTSAESVDVVTRAGAGGKIILAEAARTANSHEEVSDMDAAELKKLQESVAAQTATNARLLERAIKGDAREEIGRILKTTSLVEAAKERVMEGVLANVPTKDGELDKTKLTEAVNESAKREGAYIASLTGSGHVRGMGTGAPVEIDAKEAERKAADRKHLRESRVRSFTDLGMPKAAAEKAADRDEEAA